MKKIQLSDRLSAVAGLVTPGNRIADVGCDHGYIPISLYEEGKIPGALAMDVNPGPLMRASEHIREHGLGDYIETRLSNGVQNLRPGEADTVIIAGMGGPLMEKIISEGRDVLTGVREFILQPQSEIGHFRHFLLDSGYKIVREDMVFEDGKYYPMIKAIHKETDAPEVYRYEYEYQFGKYLIENRHPVLIQFLQKEKQTTRQLLEHLREAGTETADLRSREVKKEQTLICQALEAMAI